MARDFKKKECFFLKNNFKLIDFKDGSLLKRFLSDNGKILPRRITGTSAYWQRQLAKAVKLARQNAILPYTRND
ncbi:30S ribosomal protein S18 [Vampirovibrio sp.]|uniref:30S ribosomal protein S18 n=1 Tax=Vampirovibrio sp. TaxID=2717857 RepID=UPI0035934894